MKTYRLLIHSGINGRMDVNATLETEPIQGDFINIPMLNHKVQVLAVSPYDSDIKEDKVIKTYPHN